MNGSVKFFDSRQRYLLFVTTTNEKAVVSEKISRIIDEIEPKKPALKIFDAGVGDGAVLMNVLRSCHEKFPTIPFFVSGKDVSMEDVRLTIEKLADRLVEHPNMVFVISNLNYSEAPSLRSKNEDKQKKMNWDVVKLKGNSSYGFNQQLTKLDDILKNNWRVEENKSGNTTYENPSVIVIYREDQEFALEQIIPTISNSINEFDLVLVSQAYRSRFPVDKKVNFVINPMIKCLSSGGKLAIFHSCGNDPGSEVIKELWPDENPFPNNAKDIVDYLKKNLSKEENSNLSFKDPQIFKYGLRSQPNEINTGIATSLLFSAWNACTYVAQIGDQMVRDKEIDQSYINCVEEIVKKNDGLWFNDEMLIIEKK